VNIRTILATLSITLMPLVAAPAMASAASVCTVNPSVGQNTANGVGTTGFVVIGPSDCQVTVSIASWRAPNGSTDFKPYADQTLFDSKTATFGPGNHTLSIDVDSECMWQLDLVRGGSTNNGTADYTVDQMIAFATGGDTVCQPPKTPQPPVTPPATPPAPQVPAQPTQLVNTGPGEVVGLFSSTTILGAAGHRLFRRK
jgi:hypothetical protein